MPAPWKSTYCSSCGHFGRPRYSWIYALCLLLALGFGAVAVWYWQNSGSSPRSHYGLGGIALAVVACWRLLFSKNAQRCRRCDAIGW